MEGKAFVITIVAMVLFAGFINHWLKLRHSKNNENEESTIDEVKQTLAEVFGDGMFDDGKMVAKLKKIDDLENRIIVLEKIATDKKHSLAEEIDRL
jgi:hypothetical protein